MNRYEADTTQFRALVAKGHPKLAVIHLFIRSYTVKAVAVAVMAIVSAHLRG